MIKSLCQADEEHKFFIMDNDLYCYKVIPFGLKNAGATYQRIFNRMFTNLIAKIMEVYVDDMLVKILKIKDHVEYLDKAFQKLQKYRMRLTFKLAFEVALGQFLRLHN